MSIGNSSLRENLTISKASRLPSRERRRAPRLIGRVSHLLSHFMSSALTFTAALTAVPGGRTWAADRTIMLRTATRKQQFVFMRLKQPGRSREDCRSAGNQIGDSWADSAQRWFTLVSETME
jgi:hypothetical protein